MEMKITCTFNCCKTKSYFQGHTSCAQIKIKWKGYSVFRFFFFFFFPCVRD